MRHFNRVEILRFRARTFMKFQEFYKQFKNVFFRTQLMVFRTQLMVFRTQLMVFRTHHILKLFRQLFQTNLEIFDKKIIFSIMFVDVDQLHSPVFAPCATT